MDEWKYEYLMERHGLVKSEDCVKIENLLNLGRESLRSMKEKKVSAQNVVAMA